MLLGTAGSCCRLLGANSGAPVHKPVNKNLPGSEPGPPAAGSAAPVNKAVNGNLPEAEPEPPRAGSGAPDNMTDIRIWPV